MTAILASFTWCCFYRAAECKNFYAVKKAFTEISEEGLGGLALCPLKEQCITLWEWSQMHRKDLRKMEKTATCNVWEKTNTVNKAMKQLMFALLGFDLALVWYFFYLIYFFLLEWDCLPQTIVCWKYLAFFSILTWVYNYDLALSPGIGLDIHFWGMLEL